MKKKIGIIILALIMTLTTGCVKFNVSMDIKEDKSMTYSIIYAIDSEMFDSEESMINQEQIEEMKKQGFIVEDYANENMQGFRLTKEIANIDTVSTTDDNEYNLSNPDGKYIFKVKKGFLKNTYTANFKFDALDSDMNNSFNIDGEDNSNLEDSYMDDETNINDDAYMMNENPIVFDEENSENMEASDDTNIDLDGLNDMMSNMDLKFSVTLPYSALSNNATQTANDNKTLRWELMSEGAESISFSFELYNLTNIMLVVGAVILIIVLIVVIILIKKIKGKKDKNNSTPVEPDNTNQGTPSLNVLQPTVAAPAVNPVTEVMTTAGVEPEKSIQVEVTTPNGSEAPSVTSSTIELQSSSVPSEPNSQPSVTMGPVLEPVQQVPVPEPVQQVGPVLEPTIAQPPMQPESLLEPQQPVVSAQPVMPTQPTVETQTAPVVEQPVEQNHFIPQPTAPEQPQPTQTTPQDSVPDIFK
ncbi:MAG: hypothetical protein IJ565_04350 [Bacilli bacterium]|nr:hypothetical protein [Bacilli bacterium]